MAEFGRNLEIMAAVAEVNRRLGQVASEVEDQVKQSMLIQAGLIAAEIRRVAPVGDDKNQGALKNSVRVVEGKSTAKLAYVVRIEAGDARTTGPHGFDYACAVEFGTRKMPAHPFFWPIWRLRRHAARLAVRKVAVAAVREVWGDK